MAELCGAKKRQGEGTCGRPAGWGTNHLGVGPCKLHGGNTRAHNRAAAPAVARQLGAEVDMEPIDALLWCVRLAAGEVRVFTELVAELAESDWKGAPLSTVDRPLKDEGGAESASQRAVEVREGSAELHIWIKARQAAMDRLAKFTKMALDAGVAERQIELAERWAEGLAALLGGVLDDLELTAAQRKRAPEVVRRRLAALESGNVVEGRVAA